ncbi:hypothetical protein BC936DRAFT_144874 [Jimgerdemannia flammicorona]|uniref:Uncharacterized protein n=1 Tax=Jimgerdemannia flammicorona TaxID=994334 RepID=A0A433DBG5_9FUNG|nr:hypothetical protein BC936DRAFT_144874 [Jimgerdemannia flammicorona]
MDRTLHAPASTQCPLTVCIAGTGSEQSGSEQSGSPRDSTTAVQAVLALQVFGRWKDAAPSTPHAENDETPLRILPEVSVDLLDSNEVECSPRVVVFRIKDGVARQRLARQRQKRSRNYDSTCSKAAKIAVDPTPLEATSTFLPISSTNVSSVDLQTSFCIAGEPAVYYEMALHSESRVISLQDTEVVPMDNDEENHLRSSKIDVQFLIRLNRFNSSNVLKGPQQWRLGEVGDRITKFQAAARGYLLRTKPRIRELKEPVSSSPSIGPALRAPEPIDYSTRYMTVDRFWTECALTEVDPTEINTHPAIFIVNVQARALRYIIRKKVDAFWIHHVAASRIQAAWRGFKTRNFLVPAIIFRLLRRCAQRRLLECAPEAENDQVLQLERRMDRETRSREAMEGRFEEVVDEVSIPGTYLLTAKCRSRTDAQVYRQIGTVTPRTG